MPQHYSLFELLDFSQERSSAKIYNGAVTVTSIAGFITAFGQMRDAIDDITLGTMSNETWVGDNTLLSNASPASAMAQRELKWKVNYRDTVTQKKYYMTIPTADPVGRLIAGTDLADFTNAEMQAFKVQFEAFARCPDNDQNAVIIDSVQLVGRNI